MKILYVTPAWPGFEDCLYNGAEFASGLPSFNKPLFQLIKSGNEVDFVLITTKLDIKFNIKASWLREDNIKAVVYHDEKVSLATKVKNIFRLINKVNKVLKGEKYDFVYAHGSSTAVARLSAKKYQVPFGQRLYGTFLWSEMERLGLRKACIRHFIEYRSFVAPKEFLIVTNDGSKGDRVYSALQKDAMKNKFVFKYWVNGVDRPRMPAEDEIQNVRERYNIVDKPFIFYPARVDGWKRQDRAVRIISELKKSGRDVHLYYAGLSDNRGLGYFNEINELIKELNVEDNVTYMGNLDMVTMNAMNSMALAAMSLYDVCNLTNVFHEMLAIGAVIIVKNDDTVNDYIEHGVNGFLVNSDEEAVHIVQDILDNKYDLDSIRSNAKKRSINMMKTWDERCDQEIELIEGAISGEH